MSIRAHFQSWISRQWQKKGIWAWVTSPLALAYGLIASKRREAYLSGKQKPYRAPVPVLVIGNIYVGGTGKTPLACAIAELLQRQGWHPGLVSRGYGRLNDATVATGQGPDLDWQEFGDEPALIAHKTGMPVSVHQNRAQAAELLLARFAQTDIIVSDDGLQHYGLARDFEILVQDDRGTGNGFLLPAGPLRESLERLNEVDLVLTRSTHIRIGLEPGFSLQIDQFWQPATGLKLDPAQFVTQAKSQGSIAAAAGIGVPQRFFMSLLEVGITLQDCYPLADHAAIDLHWLNSLSAKTILITEKDAIKLDKPIADHRIWVAQTSVNWWRDDIDAFLTQRLAAAGIKHSES
ncbi:MAG: tetraacyldisaccharide 4'-kinase [Burkholderiaceae bacterium]|nr:tetraacyldisaccharide 4'-kinase [Burkholderiaceae bacterium]MCD8516719.1 tetraacyldisaccharide 4'-kinase [Burkholderiaceae bacterium]MCD8565157.1 tetraacyldisaccharide 4'-kinase [Burkholderiaceae bacterium]